MLLPTSPYKPMHRSKPAFHLSYAQTGVYFDCLKNPASTIYNIPYLPSYPEGIDAHRLADRVKVVIESHPEVERTLHDRG